MLKEQIVAVITNRQRIGAVLSVVYVQESSPTVLTIEGVASPLAVEYDDKVSDDVRQVVNILHRISDAPLAKHFAPSKTAKMFFEKLTDDVIKESVRPYVDKCLCEALSVIKKCGMRLFVKSERYKDIHVADEVDIAPLFKCRPRFFFTLDQESGALSYVLKVSDGAQDVTLTDLPCHALSVSPAVFVAGKTLYSFADIDFGKFRPFFKSKRIKVEERLVESYMQKYVFNCVRSYSVSAYGFEISRQKVRPTAKLCISKTIFGYGFSLLFDYGVASCQHTDRRRPTELKRGESGEYIFSVRQRDFEYEKRIVSLLTADLGLEQYDDMLSVRYRSDMQELVRWAVDQKDYLLENGIEVELSDGETNYFWGAGTLSTKVDDTSHDWFDISMVVSVGDYRIPFAAFFDSISKGDSRFYLPDGSIFIIPDEWFERWGAIIPFMQVDGETVRVARAYATMLPQDLFSDDAEGENEIRVVDSNFEGLVNASLRSYQSYGVRWMLALAQNGKGGILADDMGLGKTLQVITMLAAVHQVPLPEEGEVMKGYNTAMPPSIIIAPASLLFNWRRELERFAPQLRYAVLWGNTKAVATSLASSFYGMHVVLTTYGMVRSNVDALAAMRFKCLVLDESQFAKNPVSKSYLAIMQLRAEFRLCMSGTPVENSLRDMWAQMNIANPLMLGSRRSFDAMYRVPIELHYDEVRLKKLRNVVRPYVLRRTKGQVLDELPSITIQTVPCAMTDEQAEVYEREKSASRNELMGNVAEGSDMSPNSRRFLVLQALTRLRLIANHPSLCVSDYEGGSGKMDTIVEHVKSIASAGHKMLIFSSFVKDMQMIAARLTENGIGHEMLTGATQDREAVVSRFQEGNSSAFLISLKAGGFGLNLTCADYVLIINPWWNPAAEMQAYNRAHRMGQTNKVTVYRFVSVGTIEEKIDHMQERKLKLADDVVGVGGSNGPALEDLEALLTE